MCTPGEGYTRSTVDDSSAKGNGILRGSAQRSSSTGNRRGDAGRRKGLAGVNASAVGERNTHRFRIGQAIPDVEPNNLS